MTKTLTCIAALALLSACGGSSTGAGPTVDDFEQRLTDTVSEARAVEGLSPTAWKAIPETGRATFNGKSAILIDPVFETDDDDILVLGDARLTANFDQGTVKGRINNLTAATNFSDSRYDAIAASGRINIGDRESVVGDDFDDNRTSRPNEWFADYRGNITVDGTAYALDGLLFGEFRGTRVNNTGRSPVKAMVGANGFDDAAITGNKEYPVSVEVFGTN